jgi:hypothetical protein
MTKSTLSFYVGVAIVMQDKTTAWYFDKHETRA